jgi:hypothetical protein
VRKAEDEKGEHMTKVTFAGSEWALPYRGRFGCQIQATLRAIINHPEGISLYAAMDLHGNARNYSNRYAAAFTRFAEANTDKLVAGAVGPKGGWGFKLREPEVATPPQEYQSSFLDAMERECMSDARDIREATDYRLRF